MAKSFYVDDFNSTVHNVKEGEELYKKIKLRFLDASFNVRKWKTNSLELQNYIDKMERSISPSSDIKKNDKTKVLGIEWDIINDYLIYSFEDLVESFKSVLPTKRSILGLIAKFYDLVGLIQPVINKLKLFFQEVCLTNVDWDSKIIKRELAIYCKIRRKLSRHFYKQMLFLRHRAT